MGFNKHENDRNRVRQVTLIGMAVNIAVSIFKLLAGIIGSSGALIADAIHSISDIGTDVAIIWGAKYWTAPADDKHPYGHGKIEAIITSLIGFLLAVVAIGLGYNALNSLKDPHSTSPGMIAFVVAFFSIVIKEWLYHWTVIQGKKIQSTAVIANAWHHRSDALSSIPVAVAVIVAIIKPELAFVDHIGAMLVSLFILNAAIVIIRPAFFELIDMGVETQIKQEIEKTALCTEGVLSVHAIRTRKVGPGIFVDLHVMVDGSMSVSKGHSISREVKNNLIAVNEDIVDIVVHLEPYA